MSDCDSLIQRVSDISFLRRFFRIGNPDVLHGAAVEDPFITVDAAVH
jgi:hypothetical protein